jgi:hypothetical protein
MNRHFSSNNSMNMKKITKAIYCLLFLYVSLNTLKAQNYEFGIFAGTTNYQGDLADGLIQLKETQPAGGLIFRYSPFSFTSIRFGFTTGKLFGNDATSKRDYIRERGFSFVSNVKELSMMTEFHLPYYGSADYGIFKIKLSPFILVGMGLTIVNGQPKAPTDLVPYPFPEFNSKKNFLVMPIGGGIKLQVSDHIAISGEWATRKTYSDYIDGISTAGNPDRDDWYMFGGLAITYKVDGGGENPYKGRRKRKR